MSLPRRTLAIIFKSEELSALYVPTRRIVYDAFVLFFGGLTIPCLRNLTSLENTVRTDTPRVLLRILNRQVGSRVWSSVDCAIRIVDRVVGKDFVTGRIATNSVAIHNYKFYGKTRSLGLISTAVDIAGPML